MAMGKRLLDEQQSFWVSTSDLPRAAGHPFYERVNQILDGRGFDTFVEDACRSFYAAGSAWDFTGRVLSDALRWHRRSIFGCY